MNYNPLALQTTEGQAVNLTYTCSQTEVEIKSAGGW